MQPGDPGFGQRDARGLEELAGLALSETQIGRADLGQVTGETELVQPQGQITPRREDRVHMLGELLQQPGQLGECFRRGQLVEIIDDQERAVAVLGEFRQDPVGDGRFVEVGRRCQLLAFAPGAGGAPDRGEDGEPELLGVPLVAPHLHNREPVRATRTIGPGPQQRSLAAARRSRDQRYLRFRRAVEGRDKFPALNQPQRRHPDRLRAGMTTSARPGSSELRDSGFNVTRSW